MARVDDNGDQ